MRSVEATGRTVEEAVAEAVRQLGVDRSAVMIEVLEEPSRGLLGLIGQRPARVRATYQPTKAEAALQFVRGLCERLGLSVQVSVRDEADSVVVEIAGADLGALIGRRGQTLEAVQYLANVAAARVTGDRRTVIVDAGGYRRRRQEALERLARRMAERVRRTGRKVSLEPMTAQERRIVHLALRDTPGVRTESVGEEPFRKVVIFPQS